MGSTVMVSKMQQLDIMASQVHKLMNFMKPGVFYLQKMMNFMKMRTFYKKNSILHTYKKLKPQIWAL